MNLFLKLKHNTTLIFLKKKSLHAADEMRNIRICWVVYPEVGVLENKDNFRVVLDSTGWIYVKFHINKYHGNNNNDTKINLKRIQIPSQRLF